ncbi:cell wall-binding repeat-containing protein [Desulfosporosinus youngiae]|uniref:cell wall-binding repeat-containing protein n=1 Tax=Desulfosporosinus youngiae TaxID=339862 RepID=UPI000A001144
MTLIGKNKWIITQVKPPGGREVIIATGTNFPDALSGSVIAGSIQSPIILVKPNEIPEKVSLIYLNALSNKTETR